MRASSVAMWIYSDEEQKELYVSDVERAHAEEYAFGRG